MDFGSGCPLLRSAGVYYDFDLNVLLSTLLINKYNFYIHYGLTNILDVSYCVIIAC